METPNPIDETVNNGAAATEAATDASAAPAEAAQLKSELNAANAKAAEYLDGWQRARADFANYKKRMEREQAEARGTIAAEVLTRVLPALDDFELALKNAPAEGDGVTSDGVTSDGVTNDAAKWAEGLSLVYRKLTTLIEKEGIVRIEADGQLFDPNLHEAVVHEESANHPEGYVIEVLRQGYKLGERVLRPALVKVSK